MTFYRSLRWCVALLPLALGLSPLGLPALTTPAFADTFDLITTDGPMRLHINHDGEVTGAYPKRQGVMHGHVGPDGTIHGIWFQPRSDHPCRQPRGDTYAWGFFTISHLYHRNVEGSWGYCNEEPARDWEMERD